jgi:prefoldin beta subunit
MEETTQQKIQQLQLAEQSVQSLLMQKKQFQSQVLEIENALKELETSKKAYKVVGTIMVESKKEDLTKELQTKKETAELRIKTIEKQEKTIKEKTSKLQKEVLETLKNEKK